MWSLSLEYMCQQERESTERLLSKTDRDHLVASRRPFFHKRATPELWLFWSLFGDSDRTQRDYRKASYPLLVSN